jgi:predicted HD superfamily hydrolase involved in NAD metabolism
LGSTIQREGEKMKTIEEMKLILQASLTPKRYKHSLGVADTAAKLAELYGYDSEKAYIAGLVHDCAKDMTLEHLLKKANAYNVMLDDLTIKSAALAHGPVGAQIAKHEFGISDEDIISSVFFHTTGKADMTLLEKIIYLSDFIEPGRNYDGVNKLREIAHKDLNSAVYQNLSNTIKFVVSMNAPLHIKTVEARNFFLLDKS